MGQENRHGNGGECKNCNLPGIASRAQAWKPERTPEMQRHHRQDEEG